MDLGRSKALFGLLSAAAVVAPASVLAWMGVRSNLAERERARASFVASNQKEARFNASSLDDEAARTLDAIAPLFGDAPLDPAALGTTVSRLPLAEHVFHVDRLGNLSWPAPLGAGARTPRRLDAASAPAGGEGLKDYLRRVRDERRQGEVLAEARRAEARPDGLVRARRAYAALSAAGGTGDAAAQALLGLGRLDLRAGATTEAAARFAALRTRFGESADEEGVSYALLGDLGEARATHDPRHELALYRGLLEDAYPAPRQALAALSDETRAHLGEHTLDPPLAGELEKLDARATELRFGEALRGVADDLSRSAEGEPQVRRAPGAGERLLVYRRHGGGVLGFAVPLARLQAAAERALASEIAAGNLPAGSQVRVFTVPLGEGVATAARGFLAAEHPRLLASAQVSLWGDAGAADRAARAQLPRYLGLVGGLVLVMLVGVVATYRGAARERELGKLKSDFVSTVSHELKTPLTSIRMFGEMLREGVGAGDPERQRRYQDVIVRESERLGRLIANVLDFSQIERGARRYDPKLVEAAALAGEAVETFQRLADGEGRALGLEVEEGAAHAHVAADREAMVQSLLNLLSNAAKYGGKDAPVLVRVAARLTEVRIAVVDRGPGIAEVDQKRIFREFWRAPEARRSGVEGTGLGLALVKKHVEAHGGRIEIASAPGQGATFTLVLPRAPENDEGTT
jgi:signal transduction histidine kinase